MTNTGCPSVEDLSRQITLGEAGPLAEHVASCRECGAEWDGAQRLRALLPELPTPSPEASAVSAVKKRVLEEARVMEVTRRRRRVVASALAVAAMVGLAVSAPWKGRPGAEQPPAYHAVLTAAPSATFVRVSGLPNEVVRLDEGTLHVEVEKLRSGERFVVHAGDGEVEVRGTAFDVTVLDGHLSSVHVERGRVEVRAASAPPAVLSIGEEWKAVTAHPDPVAPSPELGGASPPAPVPEVAPLPVEPSRTRPRGSARTERTEQTDMAQPQGSEPTSEVVAEPARPPEVASPAPAPSAAPPPVPTLPAAPVAPTTPPTAPAAPASPVQGDPRDRDDARRERRDERHERYDQRRLR